MEGVPDGMIVEAVPEGIMVEGVPEGNDSGRSARWNDGASSA